MDQCPKSEAGVVVLGSRTSDGSTAPQSLYILGLLKRFSMVPRMKEVSAPAPAPGEVQGSLPDHQAQATSLLLSLRMEIWMQLHAGLRAVAVPLLHRRHSLCPGVPFCLHWAAWWGFEAYVFSYQRCARSWHMQYPNAFKPEGVCIFHEISVSPTRFWKSGPLR